METHYIQNGKLEWRVIDFGSFRRIFGSKGISIKTKLTVATLKENVERFGVEWEKKLARQEDTNDPIRNILKTIPLQQKNILLLGDPICTEVCWLAEQGAAEITILKTEKAPMEINRFIEEGIKIITTKKRQAKWDMILCLTLDEETKKIILASKERLKKKGSIIFLFKKTPSIKHRLWIKWNLPNATKKYYSDAPALR